MAELPLKTCAAPGCSTLVRGKGRCPIHQQIQDEAVAKRKQDWLLQHSDRYSMYQTREWRRARQAYLLLNPTCSCGSRAVLVDHIRPWKDDLNLFWDQSNWQPLCRSCHGIKCASEGYARSGKRETL